MTDIRRVLGGESGIVINWLVKVIIGFVVVGLLLFEAASLVLVRATAADTAAEAAQEAGFTYRDTRDEERAAETAKRYAENEGTVFISLVVDDERDEIQVTLQKSAKTIFVHLIDAFEPLINVEVTESAPQT